MFAKETLRLKIYLNIPGSSPALSAVPCALCDTYLCRMRPNDDLQQRWWNLEAKLMERFDKKPDLETILFLIGIQEFGDIKDKFTKEQKQDLMHIAVCNLLAPSGYYELERVDEEGWPHFKQL